ncbi:MAG TPA: hypothetical protein VN081_04175 [Dongiaceae bacterium]|nr:hypothetical protein [Dongiaceae bacterium]
MNEEPHVPSRFVIAPRYRFAILIVGAIIISFVLVMVSLSLYVSSGASQLDLSRPGIDDSIRKQASADESFKGFDASGPIDSQAMDEFNNLYDSQLKQLTTIKAFGGDVLSDNALQLQK